MLQEYKSIRAIYPLGSGVIKCACYICGDDVKLDNGFVDMTRGPYKGYLCSNCASMAIGDNNCSLLLMYSQETFRESKG